MVAGGKREGNSGGVGKGVTKSIRGHGIAIDVERHAVVRAGAEGVAPSGGDFEEAGETGGGVNGRATDGVRPITQNSVTEIRDGEVITRETDASDLGANHGGRGRGERGKTTREATGDVAERGHIGSGEHRVLNAQRVGTAERHGAREGVVLAEGHEVGEDQRSLTDINRLVSRITEDDDRDA